MSLINHLKSKWLHSDPEVRARAVRELDKEEVELLASIARNDAEPKVRRIAIKRLETPRTLLEIAKDDADDGVREFAQHRAGQLLVQIATDERDLEESKRALALLDEPQHLVSVLDHAKFKEIGAAALERIADDRSRGELVRRGTDAKLRAQTLALIEDPMVLRDIVTDRKAGDFAATALDKIEDVAALEAIAEQRALSKTLRRQALQKLEALVDDSHPLKVKEREEACLALCAEAEAISAPDTDDLSRLENRWAELSARGEPSAALAVRFQQAIGPARELSSRLKAREEEKEQQEQKAEADQRARTRLCEEVENLRGDDIPDGLASARAEWHLLGASSKGDTERFARACREASSRHEVWKQEGDNRRTIVSLVEQAEAISTRENLASALDEWMPLEKRWLKLSALAPEELARRVDLAGQRLKEREAKRSEEQEKREQETFRKLEERTSRLEAMASADELSLKAANRELKAAQDFLKDMGPLPRGVNRKKSRQLLMQACASLLKQALEVRETEDWKRWANADIQEKLIRRVEELKDSTAMAELAKQLRTIHEEWRRAGAAPTERAEELWNRYKGLRDELRAKCDAFFEKQNVERGENLKKKEALCEQVEAASASEDWNETADRIKEIQAEWKKTGPAPQKQSDAVWRRFRGACDAFFSRRKEHFETLHSERDENFRKKEALCERVEAIQDSMEWSQTAQALKDLQAEWKTIGAVPRKKSDKVWKRFRKACDHFFDRYKRRDEVERDERREQLASLIQGLESTDSESDETGGEVVEKAQTVWSSWRQVAPPPDAEDSGFRERVEHVLRTVIARSPEAFRGTDLDPAGNLRRRLKICERLESIVRELEPSQSQESGSLEDLASRLENALATNTITGGQEMKQPRKLDWRAGAREVQRLEANWHRTAPVPGDDAHQVTTRFDDARRSFQAMKPKPARPREPVSEPG